MGTNFKKIEKLNDNGEVLNSFSKVSFAAIDVQGDTNQILLAIKYNKKAYGFYWRGVSK